MKAEAFGAPQIMTGILMTLLCLHVWTAKTHISLANITSSSPQSSTMSVTVPLHIHTRLGIVSFYQSVRTRLPGVSREQTSKRKRGPYLREGGLWVSLCGYRGGWKLGEKCVQNNGAWCWNKGCWEKKEDVPKQRSDGKQRLPKCRDVDND